MSIKKISFSLACFGVSACVHAAVPVPTLGQPADKTSNWLYNDNGSFTWQAVPKATYRFLISDRANFENFDERGQNCLNSGCYTFATKNSYAWRGNLPGFLFYSTRYYWKVRAVMSDGRIGDWSAVRWFEPSSAGLKMVVTNALRYVDQGSPQSIKKPGQKWQNDTEENDGEHMRVAIRRLKAYVDTYQGGYGAWVRAGRYIPNRTRNDMIVDLRPYPAVYADRIVDHIRDVYAGTAPSGDGDTLLLLGIRAQCKEFADRMVDGAGLSQKTYAHGASVSARVSYPRPGMYAFQLPETHSGIVRAVRYDSNGMASFMIIESNHEMDSNNHIIVEWSRPKGSVPWNRMVRGGRIQELVAPYVVVDPSK